MYSKAITSVKLPGNNGLSDSYQLKRGLREGCNLSPLLFNLYINDLPELLNHESSDTPCLGLKPLSCLLYTDDLVLISRSRTGLQNGMDRLAEYCLTWQLAINGRKTQVVVVSKGGKISRCDLGFQLGDKKIDTVKSYVYLGLLITNSGSLRPTMDHLTAKAIFALSILQRYVLREHIAVVTALQLFSALVAPIITYGCEIWGVNSGIVWSPIEKVQLRFARFLLGVSSKTPIIGVRGELGLLPLHNEIQLQTIGFWKHILLHQPRLLFDAYKLSVTDSLSFASTIQKICTSIRLDHVFHEQLATGINLHQFRDGLKTAYSTEWQGRLNDRTGPTKKGKNKLRTYAKFKQDFVLEHYIKLGTFKDRQAITKFCISDHRLDIELGRRRIPYVPPELRYCTKCNAGTVGDELHFLFECEAFADQRQVALGRYAHELDCWDKFSSEQKLERVMQLDKVEEIWALATFFKNAI